MKFIVIEGGRCMEIEKKYLVKEVPFKLENLEKEEIEQGYLCIKPTVRIRKSNDDYFLNYKWKNKSIVDENAIHNIEYEMPLTKENYEHLLAKVDDYMIIKTRYIIPLEDGHKVELDVFSGNLKGLMFAEIEFSGDDDVMNFKKPEWLGEDITTDKFYDNTLLSKLSSYDQNNK